MEDNKEIKEPIAEEPQAQENVAPEEKPQEITKVEEKPEASEQPQVKEQSQNNERPRRDQRGPNRNRDNRRREPRPKLYDEEIINISRVTKVTKGGRNFRFSATVAVGDRKGKVGIGTGKANEVPDAVKKAVAAATKNITVVSIVEGTIPHEAIGKRSGSKVLIKPAGKGTGVKAGGAVRSVVELAGVKDILSKSLGSNTKINVAHATLDALKSLKTIEQVAALRGKTVEEIR